MHIHNDPAEFNAEHQLSHKAEDMSREEMGGMYDVMMNAEGTPSTYDYPNEGEDDLWVWDEKEMTFKMKETQK